MSKFNYLIDTNVILAGFKEFLADKEDVGIIIPSIVLEELDNQKTREGEIGYKARRAVKHLFEIKKYGNLNDWVKLDKNISIKIEHHFDSDLHLAYSCNDDIIIGCLSRCNKLYGKTVLVSNDIAMSLKSEGFGFETQRFHINDSLYKDLYKGYLEVEVDDNVINKFYKNGGLDLDDLNVIPFLNQFVILKSNINPKRTAIGIFTKLGLENPKYFSYEPSGMKPRNLEQKMSIELLMRDEIPVVSFTGVYGSAKTFTQLAVSLDKVLTGKYNKILLVKPPMPLDRNLQVGFKPGNILEKYINTLGSITSNLEALKEDKKDKIMNGVRLLEGYITQDVINVVSIEDILGSSYNNCIVLAEEMQLLTKDNMEALLSRLGNSRMFINGDLLQSSRLIQKDTRDMGLYHFIETFKDSEYVGHLTLSSIQRSEFVKELAEKWHK